VTEILLKEFDGSVALKEKKEEERKDVRSICKYNDVGNKVHAIPESGR
jgi:hypothetical protein